MGFSLSLLVGVLLILLWELGGALHLHSVNNSFNGLLNGFVFGFYSSISEAFISLTDIGYICLSSIVSVFIHEVGHALAAASEGIQMEYIAVFLAALFPGALVAFNLEVLQALPRNAALRIYCAGIWHNAAFCVVCSLILFLLPLVLEPFYLYGESPMVLNVSQKSPLAGHLAPGDLIVSLGSTRVHSVQEWKDTIALFNVQMLQIGSSRDFESSLAIRGRTGYCVPSYLIRGSIEIQTEWHVNDTTCPSELFPFVSIPCVNSHNFDGVTSKDNHFEGTGSIRCLNPKDVIKLKNCGNHDRSSCSCLEDESCLSPVQKPGLAWVEITYSRPSVCQKSQMNSFPEHKPHKSGEMNCTSTFTFLGDIITLGHALRLTSYQPRWSINFGSSLPTVLEKLCVYAFHVSLALALLNSLPVYFLDGECILEVILQHSSFLRQRTRRRLLQWILAGGTFVSVLVFIQTFLFVW
ncbi:OLC1v1025574C1 [Oldenlandia corymbosa var. corymbosa]|uniref:Endopeptidase S2P n=1 Tax=Oldenlandia corymbosa var. corymbosa TaxID=529605 RepID=A0AAV1C517_OLDCO|nr:OLC1v1025574C1 [Oldenlandia corymbosa var. corymbosa]